MPRAAYTVGILRGGAREGRAPLAPLSQRVSQLRPAPGSLGKFLRSSEPGPGRPLRLRSLLPAPAGAGASPALWLQLGAGSCGAGARQAA